MRPFEHLSVLISIILGLGIAHLLSSVHRLIQAHAHVRGYWLSYLWVTLIFVALVEWWWASFEFRQQAAWNFFYFLFLLLSPVTLYLAAGFALPDVRPGTTCDLKAYYFETRGWFFSTIALGNVLDAVRRGIEAGAVLEYGVLGNVVSALLLITLGVSRNERYHAVVTVAVTALFVGFIVSALIELA